MPLRYVPSCFLLKLGVLMMPFFIRRVLCKDVSQKSFSGSVMVNDGTIAR